VGLYGPADRTNSNIYGVLPYVAPEVLRGNSCTQASDIYSFGFIMWTLSECERPFCKDPHDLDLATRICNGLRPEIVTDTPEVYLSLMKICWHQNPEKRPNIVELCGMLDSWATDIQHNPTSMISRQFRGANRERSVFENRTIDSMAIYKSRLLNFQSLHVTR
ncbi:6298_t:CDS:1, partial [Dentiscutata heterogama]